MRHKSVIAEQIKPFYMGWKRPRSTYGLRSKNAITVLENRPWYRGRYFFDGRNSQFVWDREAKYWLGRRARTIVVKH